MIITPSKSGAPADSTSRSLSINEAYENLANAIVLQAIRDYQHDTTQGLEARHKLYVYKWLTSEDSPCRTLTDISAQWFIDHLDELPVPREYPEHRGTPSHARRIKSPSTGICWTLAEWANSEYNIHNLDESTIRERLRHNSNIDVALSTAHHQGKGIRK